MKRETLSLLIILTVIIASGGTVAISATQTSDAKHEIYGGGGVVDVSSKNNRVSSWTDDLDRIIPPTERNLLSKGNSSSDKNLTSKLAWEFFDMDSEEIKALANEPDKMFEVLLRDINPDELEYFASDFIKRESTKLIDGDSLFKITDLSVLEDPSTENVRAYGNTVGKIVLDSSPALDHEMVIFEKIVSGTGSRQEVLDLLKLSRAYRTVAEKASEVAVPNDLKETHLMFINIMKRNGLYLENMAKFNEDPALALMSLEGYLHNCSLIDGVNRKNSEFFARRGIFYGEYEYGLAYVDSDDDK